MWCSVSDQSTKIKMHHQQASYWLPVARGNAQPKVGKARPLTIDESAFD
jgi:hypothetical protein